MSKVSPAHEYCFAVGCPEAVMSSVWKVQVRPRKRDIFISESGSFTLFHISLHRDDRCHLAVREDIAKHGRDRGNPTPPKGKYYTDKWKAGDIKPDLKMPFRLVIPASELRPPTPGWSTMQQVRWLRTPYANCAYEIRLYLSKRDFAVYSPDGEIVELWRRPFVNEWALLVLAKILPYPDQERHNIELVRQQAAATLPASVVKDERLRIIVHSSAADGSRYFTDVALDVPMAPM
jgi:hypothetical protein